MPVAQFLFLYALTYPVGDTPQTRLATATAHTGATVDRGAETASTHSDTIATAGSVSSAALRLAASLAEHEHAIRQFKTVVSPEDLTARRLTDGVRQCIEDAVQVEHSGSPRTVAVRL